jgi:hypothetical protein
MLPKVARGAEGGCLEGHQDGERPSGADLSMALGSAESWALRWRPAVTRIILLAEVLAPGGVAVMDWAGWVASFGQRADHSGCLRSLARVRSFGVRLFLP